MSSRLPPVDEESLLEDEEVLTEETRRGAALDSGGPGNVDALAELFPEHPRAVLEAAIGAHPGDLDGAAAYLAMSGPDALRIAPTPAEENDLQLARALQAAENRRRSLRPRHRPPSERNLSGVAGVLRDIIVPALHAHFRELSFGDVSDTSGGIPYTLRDVRVVALSLPPENIIVRVVDGKLRVQVVNMFLQLGVGRWSYEANAYLGIRDAGKMEASVNGLGAVAHLTPRESSRGSISATVGEVVVDVEGAVRVRAEGSGADWMYNAIAVVFKPLIVSYIKESVAELVQESLAGLLRHWSYSVEEGEGGVAVPTVPSIDPPEQAPEAPEPEGKPAVEGGEAMAT